MGVHATAGYTFSPQDSNRESALLLFNAAMPLVMPAQRKPYTVEEARAR